MQRVKIGKLFMVDLAGSERLKKSLSTGAHSRATCITCEVSHAINALHATHVPHGTLRADQHG